MNGLVGDFLKDLLEIAEFDVKEAKNKEIF